jgi:hypothetical protein
MPAFRRVQGDFPTRLAKQRAGRAVCVHGQDRLDFCDELRAAKRLARHELTASAVRVKRDVARVVGRVLRDACGPHGDGYMTCGSGFGGCRWFFRCGGCRGRALHLYRPVGSEHFMCRRCWGLAYSHRDRGELARLLDLQGQLMAFAGRPGRRPRRYWRAVMELGIAVAGPGWWSEAAVALTRRPRRGARSL